MKFLKIMIFMLILFMSIGAVCATNMTSDDILSDESPDIQHTFTDLKNNISSSGNVLNIDADYKFDNKTESKSGILIKKDNFTINGNNRIVDGSGQLGIFKITGKNVTITNWVIVNGNSANGGAMHVTGQVTLNNVTFINNNASKFGGAVYVTDGGTVSCNDSRFIDNYADKGSSIYSDRGTVNAFDSYLTSKVSNKFAQIYVKNSKLNLDNVSFIDIIASYSAAIYSTSSDSSIVNSKFRNLKANISAGAIAIREGGSIYIRNCEFVNTSSSKNAGAINADIAGFNDAQGNVTILDTIFKNTYSGFGGAFIQLEGKLFLNKTDFIDNYADFNGGSVYISNVDAGIYNCLFDSNGVGFFEGYPTCGGAIYSDLSNLTIANSRFINNSASRGNAIYAYDTSYNITDSFFANNTNAIYSVFDKKCRLDNNTYNNDTILTNFTEYYSVIEGSGVQLKFINNILNVTSIPSRFDLRDWGWVSPVRNQGSIGACWTFGMFGPLESALLKSCGIVADFSENNMQNTLTKYSMYGDTWISEGADYYGSMGYLISWLGAFPQDADTYDEIGKISPVITTGNDIHIQDVIFVFNDEPGSLQIKSAILNYGSLEVVYFGQSKLNEKNPYYNPKTFAHYCNESLEVNHAVSVVGWDDNYSKDNFLIAPPGDGAWICKNSWGTSWGDDGYFYLSYYDKSFLSTNDNDSDSRYAVGFVFENNVSYNKNYQWGFSGNVVLNEFSNKYCDIFVACDDDLIAGVGTFFNRTGINYTVEIYVNDELMLAQEGVSPFRGFHTIKLDSFIPIKVGDVFKVIVTSDCVPTFIYSRPHIPENVSFYYCDGQWREFGFNNTVVVLKVYTVCDDTKIIDNNDVSVDYAGGSYFSVKVVTADGHAVGAGEKVTFKIGNRVVTATTDANGIAKVAITDVPKTYNVIISYNGKTYTNKVTVKQVLKASKVTVKKTAKRFTLKATLKINGKLVKGKRITFKFKGKTYKVKTNSKGVAQKILNKKVIKKLKKGKTYTVKVTYLKDTIKTTVKVR